MARSKTPWARTSSSRVEHAGDRGSRACRSPRSRTMHGLEPGIGRRDDRAGDAAVLGGDVFAQRVAGERVPAVVARQLDDAVDEPVEPQPVADLVVDARRRLRPRRRCGSASSAMSSARCRCVERRDLAGELGRARPARRGAAVLVVVPSALAADEQIGEHLATRSTGEPQLLTVAATGERLPAVAQQPAAAPRSTSRAAREVHLGLHVDVDDRRRAPRCRCHSASWSKIARAASCARTIVGRGRAGLLAEAERERRCRPG